MTARTQSPSAPLHSRWHWLPCLAWAAMATGHIPAATAASSPPTSQPPAVCRVGTERPVARAFLGYSCRDARCGSHKAGFDWAERNGIDDARACQSRNDVAFTEGCRVYAHQTVTAEQAGFQWARDNELTDTCLCAGAGPAFEAGCEAFVRGIAD
jgi:hypothetical protein